MERKLAAGAAIVVAAALLAAAPIAATTNLLTNGDFDTDVSGWSVTSADADVTWLSEDADGSPTSGALGVINRAVVVPPTTLLGLPATQCVTVEPGVRHVLFASAMIPPGPPDLSGGAQIRLQFSPNPSCTFQGVPPPPFIAVLPDLSSGQWGHLMVGGWSPDQAKSAHVALITTKGQTATGEPVMAAFDNVSLLPLPFVARLPMVTANAE